MNKKNGCFGLKCEKKKCHIFFKKNNDLGLDLNKQVEGLIHQNSSFYILKGHLFYE